MNYESVTNDEIISFPVPKRFLPVVIHALSKAMAEVSSATVASEIKSSSSDKIAEELEPKIDWTVVDNLKKLRTGLSIPVALKLLQLTSDNPGEMVPFERVYREAGFTESRRAGSSLGALTKVIKREFNVPYERANWPVEHYWGINEDSQYYYRMSPDVATAWALSTAGREDTDEMSGIQRHASVAAREAKK